MERIWQKISPLLALCILLPAFAGEARAAEKRAVKPDRLMLDGRSFPGRIRAEGSVGLVSVQGTLSFKEGRLIWAAKDSKDSAPYQKKITDGQVRFTARVEQPSGATVDWSGAFDGDSVSNVKAVWTRAKDDDFFHDLFLPAVVTLIFKPDAPRATRHP